jgi:hypothetical protein
MANVWRIRHWDEKAEHPKSFPRASSNDERRPNTARSNMAFSQSWRREPRVVTEASTMETSSGAESGVLQLGAVAEGRVAEGDAALEGRSGGPARSETDRAKQGGLLDPCAPEDSLPGSSLR